MIVSLDISNVNINISNLKLIYLMVAQSLAESTEFPTWGYLTDQPMSLEAVRQMVKKLPGGSYDC